MKAAAGYVPMSPGPGKALASTLTIARPQSPPMLAPLCMNLLDSPIKTIPPDRAAACSEPLRPYRVRYSVERPQSGPQLLACVAHGGGGDTADPRWIDVGLPLLHGPAFELWESPEPVQSGRDHGIGFACNSQVLIGHLRVTDAAMQQMERAAFRAYALIDSFLQRRGYPAWLRVWNYIPGILRGTGDDERYRRFVEGRYRALSLKPEFEASLPAATAIGSRGGDLLIYFLAAKLPGVPVENPRQLSAYRYPRQYGPRSPSFSRAMLVPWRAPPELLVSGTASVVGSETRHAGQPQQQLGELLENLEALTGHASALHLQDRPLQWVPQVLKLYVRDAADAARSITLLAPRVPAGRLVVMQGDICRSDLSLEVEAHYQAVDVAGASVAPE